MKPNKTFAALAVFFLFLAGHAAAGLNLNGIDPSRASDPVDLQITVAGSLNNAFATIVGKLCVAGSLSVYSSSCVNPANTSTTCAGSTVENPGIDYTAYFCRMDAVTVPGLSSPSRVLIRKRAAGGAIWGVQPVADAVPVGQMVLNSTNCRVTASPDKYKCNGAVIENAVSDAGLSDVEPALFKAPNVASGFTAITTVQLSRLNVGRIAVQTFGIPVTNALYTALQVSQGLEKDLDGDAISEGQCENASETEIAANMPMLSRAEVAAFMKGNFASWNDYKPGNIALPAWSNVLPPSDNQVAICRYEDGSGIQAQLNALFLNVPCTTSGFAATDSSPCTLPTGKEDLACGSLIPYDGYAELAFTTSPIIHEVYNPSNMTACLDQLQDHNRWAMGIHSLEHTSENTFPSDCKWSYIKFDCNAYPHLHRTASTQYFDWAEATMQWRKTAAGGVAPPTGNRLTVLTKLRAEFTKPTTLDLINDDINASFGPTGFLAPVGTTCPFNANAPVMQYTHGLSTCYTPNATGAICPP